MRYVSPIHQVYNKVHNVLLNVETYITKVIHIQSPLAGYIGFIWRNTDAATASWSTVEGSLRVHCSYCDRSAVHVVATAYPQSTRNGIPTCSSLSVTGSYETLHSRSGAIWMCKSLVEWLAVYHSTLDELMRSWAYLALMLHLPSMYHGCTLCRCSELSCVHHYLFTGSHIPSKLKSFHLPWPILPQQYFKLCFRSRSLKPIHSFSYLFQFISRYLKKKILGWLKLFERDTSEITIYLLWELCLSSICKLYVKVVFFKGNFCVLVLEWFSFGSLC